MSGQRAIIPTVALRGMAKIVKQYGVVFNGRVDPLGGLTFSMAPPQESGDLDKSDDLDDRLSRFASK